MEFRPVMHSVCRAAARPSLLAGTRPSAALLRQRHRFSTSNQHPSEAAAAAQPRPTPPHQPAQSRVDLLRASLTPPQAHLPPRPPPIRSSNYAMPGQKTTAPHPVTPGSSAAGSTPFDDLTSVMRGDMENATSTMGIWHEGSFYGKHNYQPQAEPRLRPSTGRTMHVKGQVDVARAFRMLEKSIAQNGVRRDARMQRSHERPALKRKRQKRERWQVRFKTGMRATINRVMELKAQGW
ncbi:hypothetical protein BT67DRAFT_452174 [Trichocladium antarcticum]|uniref:Ribosomal protein S21 n=1 Tax=Trichocladium antarcticum TaxID=1450529 RepID=A0AAN6ZAC8_9PEZI|nr:hypothetical protein BT67DRAFT_452174 [Trichocladium antarcticum]